MLLFHVLPVIAFLVALPKTASFDIDAKLWNNGSLPFVSVFEYKAKRTLLDKPYKQACYHKESRVSKQFENGKGEYLNVTFVHLMNARFSAEDNYNSLNHTIPILFHTRWHAPNHTKYERLLQAFEDQTVLNISFYTNVTNDARSFCTGSETVILGEEWCKWARALFTHRKIAGLPRYNEERQCALNRSDEAQHYLNMWNPGNSKDFRTKCYKRNDDCINTTKNASRRKKSKKKKCLDQALLANGRGLISKMKMSKTMDEDKTTIAYIDVNMTIDFDYWTEDLPEVFTNAHKKCLYHGGMSKLLVNFFLKEHVDRKVPPQFFAFVAIACVLGLILVINLSLVACTCSTLSFRMEIWEYWVKRNAYQKYAKEHASEIAEQAADKRMEKQEAMMSHILSDD